MPVSRPAVKDTAWATRLAGGETETDLTTTGRRFC
jgi:hypothetical protein